MRRLLTFLTYALLALLLPCAESGLDAQSPILVVDTAVQNRLALEWEPSNPYQHEKAYCLSYTSDYRFTWGQSFVVYTVTSVTRADEERTTPNSIGHMGCPNLKGDYVFAHSHPPTECNDEDENHCKLGGPWSSQCYPSSVDMGTLNRSDKPFGIILCDTHAIVPYYRTLPLPLVDTSGAHR